MTEIRVTTTVEITDNQGNTILRLDRSASADPSDNSRFFYTFTRGVCQAVEHSIGNMIKQEFGDIPDKEEPKELKPPDDDGHSGTYA
jgi:hypothetical protein